MARLTASSSSAEGLGGPREQNSCKLRLGKEGPLQQGAIIQKSSGRVALQSGVGPHRDLCLHPGKLSFTHTLHPCSTPRTCCVSYRGHAAAEIEMSTWKYR